MDAENRITVKLWKQRLSAAMPWISLAVVLLVFWWLKMTGITLAGDAFCGICRNGDEAYAAVQLSGAAKMTYSGTEPVCGYAKLAASADGVQASDGGREYLVVEVDTQAKTVTFIM